MKKVISCILAVCIMLVAFPTAVYADEVYYLGGGPSTDYMPITIDGNYDDWNGKPFSKIQYPWDNGNRFHMGCLFRDDTYVYLAVIMSDLSYTQFNGYNYRFTVDGIESYVVVVTPDGSNVGNGNTDVIVRNQNGYGIIPNAMGMVTREANKGDKWELKIPLSFFSSNPDTIREIKFHSSNLGPQELIATGTDTAPYVIVGIGLAMASFGFVASKKHKKRKLFTGTVTDK